LTARRKHVPFRTCIACHQKRPKRELLRVVRQANGRLEIDPKGKLSGRGAYLCPSSECWDGALVQGKLARAFKCEVDAGQVDAVREAVLPLLVGAELAESHIPSSKGSNA